MKNNEVIQAFYNGNSGSSTTLMSTGNRLISYHTCVAQWYKNKIYVNATSYSSTTAKHTYLLRNDINVIILQNHNIPKGIDFLTNYIREEIKEL